MTHALISKRDTMTHDLFARMRAQVLIALRAIVLWSACLDLAAGQVLAAALLAAAFVASSWNVRVL